MSEMLVRNEEQMKMQKVRDVAADMEKSHNLVFKVNAAPRGAKNEYRDFMNELPKNYMGILQNKMNDSKNKNELDLYKEKNAKVSLENKMNELKYESFKEAVKKTSENLELLRGNVDIRDDGYIFFKTIHLKDKTNLLPSP